MRRWTDAQPGPLNSLAADFLGVLKGVRPPQVPFSQKAEVSVTVASQVIQTGGDAACIL